MLKLKFTLLMFVLSLTVSAIQKDETFSLHFSESDYSYNYDEQGNLVITANDPMTSYSEADEPGLPFVATNIAIPRGKRYLSSSAQCIKRLIKSNVNLAPGPMVVPTDGSVETIPQNEIVYEEKVYPTYNCQYSTTTYWSNTSMLHFLSCPFVYDAAEKNLYFIDTMELTVTTDDQQTNVPKRSQEPNNEFLRSIALNPEAIDETSNDIVALSDVAERIDYVIITSSALKKSFERLLNWKRKKGLYVTIATVEEINSMYPDGDCQLKIKKYLYDLYIHHSLKYVLLGGDNTVVPPRGCYITYSNLDITHENAPADLYYACFDGNFEWNENGNALYGETGDGVNFTQSVYVSRVPVRTVSDTNAFVDKLLSYEQSPCWSEKILSCGHKLAGYNSEGKSDAECKGDKIYEEVIEPYWNGIRTKFYDTYTDFAGGADYDLTPASLMKELSQGYAFMDMATHGSPTAWGLERDSLYSSMHGRIQTNICSTIITTTSCHTNAFDSSHVGYPDPCLSESFIRNSHSGIVAYLGSSREGIEYSGGSLGPSCQYDLQFYKNLFSSTIIDKNYAKIVALAKAAMVTKCSWYSSERWLQLAINAVGDPEMPIFTSKPQNFDNVKIYRSSNNTTYVDSGIEGCRICVMSENDNGNSFYKVYENVRTVSLDNLPVSCSICITKQGYIPCQYRIYLLQNETLEGTNTYSYDEVRIGSSLTSAKVSGPVTIKSGITEIKASTVIIDAGTRIEKNAVFRAGE